MIGPTVVIAIIIQVATGDANFTWQSLQARAALMKLELTSSNRFFLLNETPSEIESYVDEAQYDKFFMLSLRNSTIRVLARELFPFIIFDDSQDDLNGSLQLTGFVGDMWKILQEHLGFRTVVKLGRIGHAMDWDVVLNPQELSVKKLAKYSYTFPITKIWYHLYARGIQSWSYSMIYFEILDRKLWIVVLVVAVGLSVFLWVTWKIRRTVFELNNYGYDGTDVELKDINYSTCFLSVLGCMTNQGSQFKGEKSSSIRIITLMCILLGLILSTSFSALLISKLATTEEEHGENIHLRSLAENPRGRTLCVAKSSYAYKKISKRDPHYLKGTSLTINTAPHCTLGDHDFIPYEDYCSEQAVIMDTTYNAAHAINIRPQNVNFCTVYIYTKRYYQAYLILVTQKGFPYLRIINKYLLRMEESGLMKKINDHWKSTKFRGSEAYYNNNNKIKVGFYHIRTVVLIYLAAVFVSLIILGMELLYKWLN